MVQAFGVYIGHCGTIEQILQLVAKSYVIIKNDGSTFDSIDKAKESFADPDDFYNQSDQIYLKITKLQDDVRFRDEPIGSTTPTISNYESGGVEFVYAYNEKIIIGQTHHCAYMIHLGYGKDEPILDKTVCEMISWKNMLRKAGRLDLTATLRIVENCCT